MKGGLQNIYSNEERKMGHLDITANPPSQDPVVVLLLLWLLWLTRILQRWQPPSPLRRLCLPSSPEGLQRLGLNRMLAPLRTRGSPQKWEGCRTQEQLQSHLSKHRGKQRKEKKGKGHTQAKE